MAWLTLAQKRDGFSHRRAATRQRLLLRSLPGSDLLVDVTPRRADPAGAAPRTDYRRGHGRSPGQQVRRIPSGSLGPIYAYGCGDDEVGQPVEQHPGCGSGRPVKVGRCGQAGKPVRACANTAAISTNCGSCETPRVQGRFHPAECAVPVLNGFAKSSFFLAASNTASAVFESASARCAPPCAPTCFAKAESLCVSSDG